MEDPAAVELQVDLAQGPAARVTLAVQEPVIHHGSHAALELVINKVSKTTASGYLSVPKATGTASASAAATPSAPVQ